MIKMICVSQSKIYSKGCYHRMEMNEIGSQFIKYLGDWMERFLKSRIPVHFFKLNVKPKEGDQLIA